MYGVAVLGLLLAGVGCVESSSAVGTVKSEASQDGMQVQMPENVQTATIGGGCFWCVEAVFEEVAGVLTVVSGYAGGTKEDPTYQEIGTGTTGHAEVVQIKFDPAKIAYQDILEIYFLTHDPTTLNRQGADVGTQYRSIILAHDDEQKAIAERAKKELDASGAYDAPIVTEIAILKKFYLAEDYHQDYFANNPEKGYCQIVIKPKMEKFRKVFKERLKKDG